RAVGRAGVEASRIERLLYVPDAGSGRPAAPGNQRATVHRFVRLVVEREGKRERRRLAGREIGRGMRAYRTAIHFLARPWRRPGIGQFRIGGIERIRNDELAAEGFSAPIGR